MQSVDFQPSLLRKCTAVEDSVRSIVGGRQGMDLITRRAVMGGAMSVATEAWRSTDERTREAALSLFDVLLSQGYQCASPAGLSLLELHLTHGIVNDAVRQLPDLLDAKGHWDRAFRARANLARLGVDLGEQVKAARGLIDCIDYYMDSRLDSACEILECHIASSGKVPNWMYDYARLQGSLRNWATTCLVHSVLVHSGLCLDEAMARARSLDSPERFRCNIPMHERLLLRLAQRSLVLDENWLRFQVEHSEAVRWRNPIDREGWIERRLRTMLGLCTEIVRYKHTDLSQRVVYKCLEEPHTVHLLKRITLSRLLSPKELADERLLDKILSLFVEDGISDVLVDLLWQLLNRGIGMERCLTSNDALVRQVAESFKPQPICKAVPRDDPV